MPKLRVSDKELLDREFRGARKLQMERHDIDKPTLAEYLNITERTLRYKWDNPDMFTCRELRQLFKVLKFDANQKSSVM